MSLMSLALLFNVVWFALILNSTVPSTITNHDFFKNVLIVIKAIILLMLTFGYSLFSSSVGHTVPILLVLFGAVFLTLLNSKFTRPYDRVYRGWGIRSLILYAAVLVFCLFNVPIPFLMVGFMLISFFVLDIMPMNISR